MVFPSITRQLLHRPTFIPALPLAVRPHSPLYQVAVRSFSLGHHERLLQPTKFPPNRRIYMGSETSDEDSLEDSLTRKQKWGLIAGVTLAGIFLWKVVEGKIQTRKETLAGVRELMLDARRSNCLKDLASSKSVDENIKSLRDYVNSSGQLDAFDQYGKRENFLRLVIEQVFYHNPRNLRDMDAIIGELFRLGAKVSYEGFEHGSPIHDVIMKGHYHNFSTEGAIRLIRTLATHGYDINHLSDKEGITPLLAVIRRRLDGQSPTVEMVTPLLINELIKIGAKFQANERPLHEDLKFLSNSFQQLSEIVPVNQLDRLNHTALYYQLGRAIRGLSGEHPDGIPWKVSSDLQKYGAKITNDEKDALESLLARNIVAIKAKKEEALVEKERECQERHLHLNENSVTLAPVPTAFITGERQLTQAQILNEYDDKIESLFELLQEIEKLTPLLAQDQYLSRYEDRVFPSVASDGATFRP